MTPGPETKDLVTCSAFVVAPFVPPSPIPASAVQAVGVHPAEGHPARDTHHPRLGGDVTSPLEGAQGSAVSALHSWVPNKNLQGCSGPRLTSPDERRPSNEKLCCLSTVTNTSLWGFREYREPLGAHAPLEACGQCPSVSYPV